MIEFFVEFYNFILSGAAVSLLVAVLFIWYYVLLGISPAYQRIRDINDVATKLNESLNGKASLWIGGAIEQLNMSTIREALITTFGDLSAFNVS